MAKETIGKTIGVAMGICVVCSVFVSTASVALKERQEINKKLDKRKNILRAAGVLGEKESVQSLLKRRVKEGALSKDTSLDDLFYNEVDELWVELKTGQFVDAEKVDPAYEDERKAAKDPKLRAEIAKGANTAGFKYKSPYRRIYFTKQSAGERRIILPLHGKGLWSTMYGFIALDAADLNTILSFSFYEHGETPGLGGEVDAEEWKASWIDKKAFDQRGSIAIDVVKGDSDEGAMHEVDGLAGATLTANGVEKLVRFWLGEEGYGPLLERLAAEGGTQ